MLRHFGPVATSSFSPAPRQRHPSSGWGAAELVTVVDQVASSKGIRPASTSAARALSISFVQVPTRTVATALPAKLVQGAGLAHEAVDADDQADAVDQLGPVRLEAAGQGRETGAGDARRALGRDDHEEQQRDLLADRQRLVHARRR